MIDYCNLSLKSAGFWKKGYVLNIYSPLDLMHRKQAGWRNVSVAMGESGSTLLPSACWNAGPKKWFKILRSMIWERSSIFVCEGILKSYTSFFSQENEFKFGSNLILFFYSDKGNRSKRKKGKRYLNISDIKI